MKKYQSLIFVLLVVGLPLAVYGIVTWYEQKYTSLPVLGADGHTILDFNLKNHRGENVSLQGSKDKIIVAHFFFAHCPSICPKMLYHVKRVQEYSGIKNLQIHSFTVDPMRDSIEALNKYAALNDVKGDWHLLTGNKFAIYRLARKSYMVTATEGDGGPTDFIHSDLLVLIDTDKRIRGYYNGTDESAVNRLIADIKKLAGESN